MVERETCLRDVRWLNTIPITYWGDLDVDGLAILAALRGCFPQIQSLFMDESTLDRFAELTGVGNGREVELTGPLTHSEQQAFLRCRSNNLRLEQERIPQPDLIRQLTDEGMIR